MGIYKSRALSVYCNERERERERELNKWHAVLNKVTQLHLKSNRTLMLKKATSEDHFVLGMIIAL